jgi:hypothetical protein
MITVVTTHNLEIFKLFYSHKYHDFFKENLYLYVDKDDSSEFRKLVDPNTTKVFDKKDFRSFYGDKYLESLSTFSKIYFINMLFHKDLLNDSFYFTDDDVLLVNESFRALPESDTAIFARDMFLVIDKAYARWPKIKAWLSTNFNRNCNLATCATNFYFPKQMVASLKPEFIKAFNEYHEILYNDKNFIEQINSKSKSARGKAFPVF